jgi:hypothetical protein
MYVELGARGVVKMYYPRVVLMVAIKRSTWIAGSSVDVGSSPLAL